MTEKQYKNFLKKIDKKLDLALDAEKTSAEESFDLLYEISDLIEKELEKLS